MEGTEYSPGVRRMMAVVGSETSFDQGREQLQLLAGLAVTTKAVERQAEALGAEIAAQEQAALQQGLAPRHCPQVEGPAIPVLYVEMDGTGVPVVSAETEGRAGKQTAQARTREVKLGCVFTQTTVDARGRPRREEGSTTYTGGIETAEAFGRRLCLEAYQRGWNRAQKKVVIGDGAPWIWNLTAEHFPGAIQIVDLYHARQHLWELSGKLWPTDERPRRKLDPPTGKTSWRAGASNPFCAPCAPCPPPPPRPRNSCATRPIILPSTPPACATRPFAASICSWAPGSSRPAARPSSAVA